MRKLITTSRPVKLRPPMPVSRGFAHFIGRSLTRAERIVISRLERASTSSPVLIIDPPGIDSTEILRNYLYYRLSHSLPHTLAIICEGATRATLTRLPGHKALWNISPRTTSHLRGCNPEFALLLNMQNFRRYSPFRRNHLNFLEICRAIFPYVGSGLIILHYQDTNRGRNFPLQLQRITPNPSPRITLRNATTYLIIPFITYTSPQPPPLLLESTREGPPHTLVRTLRCAGLRPTTGSGFFRTLPLCNRPAIAL